MSVVTESVGLTTLVSKNIKDPNDLYRETITALKKISESEGFNKLDFHSIEGSRFTGQIKSIFFGIAPKERNIKNNPITFVLPSFFESKNTIGLINLTLLLAMQDTSNYSRPIYVYLGEVSELKYITIKDEYGQTVDVLKTDIIHINDGLSNTYQYQQNDLVVHEIELAGIVKPGYRERIFVLIEVPNDLVFKFLDIAIENLWEIGSIVHMNGNYQFVVVYEKNINEILEPLFINRNFRLYVSLSNPPKIIDNQQIKNLVLDLFDVNYTLDEIKLDEPIEDEDINYNLTIYYEPKLTNKILMNDITQGIEESYQGYIHQRYTIDGWNKNPMFYVDTLSKMPHLIKKTESLEFNAFYNFNVYKESFEYNNYLRLNLRIVPFDELTLSNHEKIINDLILTEQFFKEINGGYLEPSLLHKGNVVVFPSLANITKKKRELPPLKSWHSKYIYLPEEDFKENEKPELKPENNKEKPKVKPENNKEKVISKQKNSVQKKKSKNNNPIERETMVFYALKDLLKNHPNVDKINFKFGKKADFYYTSTAPRDVHSIMIRIKDAETIFKKYEKKLIKETPFLHIYIREDEVRAYQTYALQHVTLNDTKEYEQFYALFNHYYADVLRYPYRERNSKTQSHSIKNFVKLEQLKNKVEVKKWFDKTIIPVLEIELKSDASMLERMTSSVKEKGTEVIKTALQSLIDKLD